MTNQISMFPVLPMRSMSESLAFYEVLGFQATYQQTKPNVYAIARREGLELHYMGLAALEPADNFTTCLVIVPEVEQLHRALADRLRAAYGKVPLSGMPRITRMKPGQSRFTIVDVAGNTLIFIKRGEPDVDDVTAKSGTGSGSRLDKVLRAAARLRDFKNDDAAAAKLLDAALRRPEPALPYERALVLAARAEIALSTGDSARAARARDEISALELTTDERRKIDRALAELERSQR